MATSGNFDTESCEGRYLTFSWSRKSYSVEKNQTTITYKVVGAGGSGYVTCGNFKLTLDGKTVYSSATRKNVYVGTEICSGEYTFTHNSAGNKNFKAYLEAGIYYIAVNCDGSGSWDLPNIPRASTPTLSKDIFELDEPITIYTNRLSTSFTHKLAYEWVGNDWVEFAEKVGASTGFSLPESLAEAIPNAPVGAGRIRCETYSGTTRIGTKYVRFNATVPEDVIPTQEVNITEPTNHIAKYGALVRGKSTLRIRTTGHGVYNSTIKSYSVYVDGKTHNKADLTTDPVTSLNIVKIAVSVTDTRDRVSSQYTDGFSVLPYSAPSITGLTVHRCNADGTRNDEGDYVSATINVTASALNNYNETTYTLKYTPLGVTNPTTTEVELTDLANTYTVSGYTAEPFLADGNYSWQVELEVEDDFTGSKPVTRKTSVSTASVLMNWGPDGDNLAIGKVAELPKGFEVNKHTHFHKQVTGQVLGLGLVTAVPSGDNLNAYTTPGVYHVGYNIDAATVVNIPVATAGRLIVSYSTGYSSAYLEHRFVPFLYGSQPNDEQTWLRYSVDGGTNWGPWFAEAIKAYPIGSCFISDQDVSPAAMFGGAWTRIDKDFTPLVGTATGAFTAGTGVTAGDTRFARSGHTLRIRQALTLTAAPSDTLLKLGTFNWEVLGITEPPMDFYGLSCFTDNANGGFMYNVIQSGTVNLTDTLDAAIATTSTYYLDLTIVVNPGRMVNSFCSKFYWQRTA